MIKERIKYTDFNGEEREEDFYFNLTEAELTELQLSYDGGLSDVLKQIVDAKNQAELIKIFKKIVLMAYGEKSPDGKYFLKNDTIRANFESTQAYSDIFMSLVLDDKKAADFINGVVPEKIREKAKETAAANAIAAKNA